MNIEMVNKINEFVEIQKYIGDEYLSRLENAYKEYTQDNPLHCNNLCETISDVCKAYTGKDVNNV